MLQAITCQCIGNPYNGPYPGPGIGPDCGYPGPGYLGNGFNPDLPFGGPGCYNPGVVNDISFPGSGIYNPTFSNDLGLPGPGYLNEFAPDCGAFPEIGFGGPIFNSNFGPDFVPCGGPIGPVAPVFGDIALNGPPCLGRDYPEIPFGSGFVGPNLPGPYANGPCPNFAAPVPVSNLGPMPPLGFDVPLGLPCTPLPQIAPLIEPCGISAPFQMPPTGMYIFSDDLLIEGPVLVSGRMPFLGAVTMEGAFTSAGAGAVSYGCGEGAVGVIEGPVTATVAPSFGFAPSLPISLPCGFSGSGLGCANRAY